MTRASVLVAASVFAYALAGFGCTNEEVDRSNSPDTLARRSKDRDWRVRAMVAMNENTPPELLAAMSRDSEWEVQCLVAQNSNTPSRILDGLSRDIDPFVRGCVLMNKNVPSGLIRALRTDPHDTVRCWATHDPSDREEECGVFSRRTL